MSIDSGTVETIDLRDWNPAPYNPRVMDEGARRRLDTYLDRFGLVLPLVVNRRTGHVIGGHRRREQLLARAVHSARAVVLDLDLDREKALNVALNNPGGQGRFDVEALDALLADLGQDAAFEYGIDDLLETELGGDFDSDLGDEGGREEEEAPSPGGGEPSSGVRSFSVTMTADQWSEAVALWGTRDDTRTPGEVLLDLLRREYG